MGRKASALGSGIVVWDEDRWCVGGFWVSLRWWVGVEGREAAAVHHSSSQVAHCGVGLQVKVSEHGPRVPAAKEADAVAVDARAEQGHGAGSAKTANRNGFGVDAVKHKEAELFETAASERRRDGEP